MGTYKSNTTTNMPVITSHDTLKYVVTHVFLPVYPPDESDYTPENDHSLARAVCAAAHAYVTHICETSEQAQWCRIAKMLDNLQTSVQSEHMDHANVISQLRGMQTGDVLTFIIRRQNAAILLTRRENCTLCEAFEVSPSKDAVENAAEPLICSYPRSAIEIPNEAIDDGNFQSEFSRFLSHPDAVDSDLPLPPPTHPQYVFAFLDGILQSVSRTADIPRPRGRTRGSSQITKHVRDYVGREWVDMRKILHVWRRSATWLLIRVAIHISVDDRTTYKRFILFFTCTLAMDEHNMNLSSDLLHLMSSTILRRISKLESNTPGWLSEMAMKTCACLQEILDARWKELSDRLSPFRNPSQNELERDTRLLLQSSGEYIRSVLQNPDHNSHVTPFRPDHRPRGTIDDFLSSNGAFFDEAYGVDPDTTIYDVQQSVERGIDDWLVRVMNVSEACAQIEALMDKYMEKAYKDLWVRNPEARSNRLLTAIELYVALDKLVVREIPMLADYSPDIPIDLLENLLLRKATSLHRLSRAYQHLATRHSQSRPGWSVLSDDFTEDSLPVRYYDQSSHLQQLKCRIEQDAMMTVAGNVNQQDGGVGLSQYGDENEEYRQGSRPKVSRSPLPALPLHAKAAVFELQCPPGFRIWRSASLRILKDSHDLGYLWPSDPDNTKKLEGGKGYTLLENVPELQPYFVQRQGPPLHWEIRLAFFGPPSQNHPTLRYVARSSSDSFLLWPSRFPMFLTYDLEPKLHFRARSTSHTSNDVLAEQADCPADLSLDEFIAFAHLRSGGSLQWLNILRALRSRTFNLRRHSFHFLLAQAVFQVGPLDLNTGTWVWHQELQDSSFCNALLDELESLFVEVGASSIDGVLMSSISLLTTRVLASSPSEDVSERAIVLLRSVRTRTFSWVQELSYDLAKEPTSFERGNLLRDMAAICRSTCYVDSAIHHKLFQSAEDVDAILSCSFFIHAFHPCYKDPTCIYSGLLLDRDRGFSPDLEEMLRDVVLADPSNYGIDLAVGNIFAGYQPGVSRWEMLGFPNARWLTCQIEAHVDRPSHTVHINLLDGALQVDGWSLGGLLRKIWHSRGFQQIFHDHGRFGVPSNLPGMDFTALPMKSKFKVHCSLRDDDLVLRVQSNLTNDILELLPLEKIRPDLPPALVDDHAHWLNLSTKIIEIRPLKQLWEESLEHWKMDCASRQYQMSKGDETLVDIRTPTWTMISKSFECLNNVDPYQWCQETSADEDKQSYPNNLIITISPIDSLQCIPRLSVSLPQYSLSFFVNESQELESRDFKDMVYDENQSVGALFGLENLLVLRPKMRLGGIIIPEALIPRCVLIPNGHPAMHGNNRVRIDQKFLSFLSQGQNEPLYYTYNVDTELSCLIGDGSSQSMRFLAYLHVMTNCHRPDPLTGKTGAHAALCYSRLGSFRSIMRCETFRYEQWASTQYPQINITCRKIINGYYWVSDRDREAVRALEVYTARRAAYLFPSNATGPASSNGHKSNNLATRVPAEPQLPFVPHAVLSQPCISEASRPSTQIALDHLMHNRPAPELPARNTLQRDSHTTFSDDTSKLDPLFASLRQHSHSSFQQKYFARLQTSMQYVRTASQTSYRVVGDSQNCIKVLKEHYLHCRHNYLDALDILKKSLRPASDSYGQQLEPFHPCTHITAYDLVRYLASASHIVIPPCWKKCLASFALLLLDLQRARRLLRYALDGLEEEFSKELENEGCDGWNAEEYPDWLLIQIQGNFLIRRSQAEAAKEIMFPKFGENTVLQVNMGEGKSSVIIPIAAAALADGNRLVRVVVPQVLAVQMFELLVSRLGGLTDRPIYHLPFSRQTNLEIHNLHMFLSRCMAERGIVLVQPEHVVSLKLMNAEKQMYERASMANQLTKHLKQIYNLIETAPLLSLITGNSYVGGVFISLKQSPDRSIKKDNAHDGGDSRGTSGTGSEWLSLQKLIDSRARDILDESDEILHSRFQLVYTVGVQQHLDGYPDRWTVTQQVLRRVKSHLHSLSKHTPDHIDGRFGSPGSFPHVQILQPYRVCPTLVSLIAEDVMAGQLPNFDFQYLSSALRDAILSFISDEHVLQDTVKTVKGHAKSSDQAHLWSGLLLLRGLLTSTILQYALAERRWRVDYGLVPQSRFGFSSDSTSMLSAPYRAKDVPAPNTQFGHPDLTVILTCLSYYYAGLSKEQLRVSFEILLDQDDPSTEYALWIKECEPVPDSLRNLGGINLRSLEQWDAVIFPTFASNQVTIDFYLSRVVFPKGAKEFSCKLSGSSWDLAEERERVITGFSGTSDGQWLLPMSVNQHELDHQKGTDARVLACLLQPENDSYIVTHKNGKRLTTVELLQLLATEQPEIRVLLDVGAQVLDLSNRQVAEAWLNIARDTSGAIYFNENDKLMMLTRNGVSQPVLSSLLFHHLDLGRCVVYLDHAHTRGTDINFPIGSRAAVTLGPKVTKDVLVQGCMRMRKLGHGHSVMFFAPPAVDQKIREAVAKIDPNTPVTTVDILCWAIHESLAEIRQRAPYWAQQGMNYRSRHAAWSDFANGRSTKEKLADAWLQPERKSLSDLYEPCATKNASDTLSVLDQDIRQHCMNLDILSLPGAQIEEEQEREVHRERECEREMELPPEAEPAEHHLHPAVVKFVKSGVIPQFHSGAFIPVFSTLQKSSAGIENVGVWSPFIVATADFCTTTKPESTRGTMDQYLRPVQWILSSKRGKVLVVLSPFEVNLLLPDIRASEFVHLHLYSPRTSKRMKPSDDLRFYTIPPLPSDWAPPWELIDQLNVFAGQLYLRDYASYLRVCRLLGVPATKQRRNQRNPSNVRGSDKDETKSSRSSSSLPFVKALLAIRTRGLPFSESHMGRILQGQILTEKDFAQ